MVDTESDEVLEMRVRRLERQVEFLLGHFGLAGQPTDPQQMLAEVLALKRAGRTIEAIKIYRDSTGLGLREAKDYVDSLR